MKKRQNELDASVLLTGLSYGEHVMRPDRVVEDLKSTLENCANAFIVRYMRGTVMNDETYCDIARFAKERNMPFAFLYAYQFAPEGKRSHFTEKIIREVKEIAGDLFLGEMFGEIGSEKAAKDKGYFNPGRGTPSVRAENMREARQNFVNCVKEMTDYNKSLGLDKSLIVEATAVMPYTLEGGITIPVLEVLPGNPENLIPFTRGAAIAYKRKMWGGFVAHEWYGGYRHEDALKIKRLNLTYKYMYMSGANLAFLESGNTELLSFGYEYDYDSELCKYYRKVIEDFHAFAKENPRPACGPYTKVAFIFGEDDGYPEFMGGSVWEQYDREEWGKGAPERSWRILSEVYRSADWHDPLSFAGGGLDLGHAPAYGTFDVIPASAPLDVIKNYSYLIFVGHNTMSKELYEKLTDYVRCGGILLSSVAHLSENPCRNAKDGYVNGGDFSELFGCKMTGQVRKNHGLKFDAHSDVPSMLYPGTLNYVADTIFTEGYADYAVLTPTTAKVRAELYSGFDSDRKENLPVVLENKLGEGYAILLSYTDYPGHPAVYPVYKNIVKSLLLASHAECDLKVTGSDKVRFSLLYDEDGKEKLYLLNTAYDDPSCVTVRYKGKKISVTLEATELKMLDF